MIEVLSEFVQEYKGSSFPTKIVTENNKNLILKMKGCGNGTISIFSEYIVNRACYELGWNVPNTEFVIIPDKFPWIFGTDEFDDIVTKSYGINLGIEYICSADKYPSKEYGNLAPEILQQIYAIDLFFINYDRSTASENILIDTDSKIWLIDHGSVVLFHNSFSQSEVIFPQNHFLNSIISDYKKEKEHLTALTDKKLFEMILSEIPKSIYNELGISYELTLNILSQRIEKIKKYINE